MSTRTPRAPAARLALLALLGPACKGEDKGADTAENAKLDVSEVLLVEKINPMIGTGGIGYAVGCGFPGPGLPFGLVKVSPDSSAANGAAIGAYHGGGYHADDAYIQGFSHMHLYAVGLTDYGLLGVMPTDGMVDSAGQPRTTEDGYRAAFDKESELARVGWYEVRLSDPGVEVALTATAHTALHRYRFPPEVAAPTLIIDLGHLMEGGFLLDGELELEAETGRARGRLRQDGAMSRPFDLWFELQVEPPPAEWGAWSDPAVFEPGASAARSAGGTEEASARLGMALQFAPISGGTREVRVRVAISTVDAAGAAANFEAEHDGFDLEQTAAAAEAAWAEQLSPIRVFGGTDDQQVIFASALYHSALMPTQFSDVDGRYRGFDQAVHADPGHRFFSDFSLWDTYRTTHPLYTMLWPGQHLELLQSLQRMDEQGDGLPRWPIAHWDGGFMVGSPADIVLAEAALKGLVPPGLDRTLARTVDVALGRRSPAMAGRADPQRYGELGYRPAEWGDSSVSTTQELALADHALALAAERLGEATTGISPADAAELARRGGFWRNLFNVETGFFQAKTEAGAWVPLSSESAWDDAYAEGNARQYRWLAPHEPEALATLMGGEAAALAHLRELFVEAEIDAQDDIRGVPEAWYWHGNEVDLHAPHLFALYGAPGEGRRWVQWVMDTWYGTGVDGIAGNDDGGTLSAWYVWSALGLYPLAGTDRYVLGLPIFDKAELDRPSGRPLRIHREGKRGPISEDDDVQILLDKQVVSGSLSHAELMAADDLRFVVR
jgi:predicted alpha-1,2-mannosidase